jgi:hypothetical protein
MALFTPSESPAIIVKEIDLTGVVPNVQTTTGAFVGNFRWGPVQEATLVPTETALVERFATPDSDNTEDFHSAAYFLRYASTLQLVREVTSAAKNAYDNNSATPAAPLVKNLDDFDNQETALLNSDHTFIARYPGTLGNSLVVSYIGANSASDSSFDNWAYASEFDAPPLTSDFASARGASNDEIHLVVVDQGGEFTGTRGTVLERYPFVSLAKNALNADGSTNYVKDVIRNSSEYVFMGGFGLGTDSDFSIDVETDAASGVDFELGTPLVVPGRNFRDKVFSLEGGVASEDLTTSEYATGFDLFEDVDQIQVDFLIAPGMNSRVDQTTIVNDMVSIAQSTRKDCVAVTSPARSDIVGASAPVTNTVTTADTFTKSSYLFMDNNYLKVYDKYNDQFIHIPAASSTAGIMAASDLNTAPWFSPAGPRRGQYLGITALSYSPNKSERDTLYKAGVNPIANIPGQGVLLFGDKTKLSRPSAFDRINVRRLFPAIERAIAIAARNVLFEFNDEFTRAEFVNVIEPFLREIQGRRGITDFRVVCDETNNTAAVVDRNEFIANIFIKPARSINFITLNFVAVRTGVDFEEVVGVV